MYKFYPTAGLLSPAFFCALASAAGQLLLTGGLAHAQAMLLPTAQLKIGQHVVHVEVAATDESRSYGLMNRTSLPPDHGMLFVFDSPGTGCFWMKNTPLPLSIAFIDAQGAIVNIARMQPYSLDTHCPAKPVQYALEMEQGWFKDHQIKAGAVVSGLPSVP